MKILRIHAPGTDAALATAIGAAVAAFNAELDIRLRFLSIGVDETVLAVTTAEGAAAAVGRALAADPADVVVLLGAGEAGLAAAASAVRAHVALVRIGAGAREPGAGGGADDTSGASRGIDQLASCHVALSSADAETLRNEGVARVELVAGADPEAVAREIVRVVTRRRQSC